VGAYLCLQSLIAAGQSSTITGTGRPNHYGRLFESKNSAMGSSHHYQLIAIVPAVIVITILAKVTGKLLIFSQVILSLQLGFAVIPLIHFVSDKTKMNGFHISKVTSSFLDSRFNYCSA
jgi:manganese transport protein